MIFGPGEQASAQPWSMKVRFAVDSPLERRRFELSVPPLNAAFRGRATWVRHRSRFRSCALLRSAMFYGGLRRGVGRRLRSSAHRVGCRRAWQRRDMATKREWRVSAAQSAAPRPRLEPRGRRHGRPSKEQGLGSEHPPSSVFVPLREEADRVLWASHACG